MLSLAIIGLILPGFMVFAGMLFVFVKLKTETALAFLNYPKCIDFTAMAIAFAMHGGNTYSGGMSATVAGLFCALATGVARKMFGYINEDVYHPGFIKLKVVIEKEEDMVNG